LTQTNSPYVVKLFYSFQSSKNLYLVQEYCNGGDCGALLKGLGCIKEQWVVVYLAQIVLALEYLHSQGIVHRYFFPLFFSFFFHSI